MDGAEARAWRGPADTLYRYSEIVSGALARRYGVLDEGAVWPDVDRVFPVAPTTARHALHIAVMRRRDVRRIMSFDSGFDGVPGIERPDR
jgi:hypothetical protein